MLRAKIWARPYGIPGVPSTFLPLMNLINSLVSNVGTTDIEQDFNDAVIQAEDTAIIVKGQHTMRGLSVLPLQK